MADTAWILQGVESALGLELAPPHRWLRHGEWTSYWLGPRRWLVTHCVARTDYEEQRDKVIDAGGALFDVSDARRSIPIDAEALAKGCGVDLDPRAFPPGECRSTLFARIGVLVARLDAATFTLFVPRSYAESFTAWINGDRPHLPFAGLR